MVPKRSIIVMMAPDAGVRATAEGLSAAALVDVQPLARLLASRNAKVRPLFAVSAPRLARFELVAESRLPDLSVFLQVDAPDVTLDSLAVTLREQPYVEAAYVKPAAGLPQLNTMLALPQPVPSQTPDFSARQLYLERAPGGVDARYAWTLPGGTGANVRIIDCEGAWRFTHEDLQHAGGLAGGTQYPDLAWRNHGTAVLGELCAFDTGHGATGIAHDALVRCYSSFDAALNQNTSPATRAAADLLRPGDLILLEAHRPGPRFNYDNRPDQRGFIPIEWWPDDLAAIQYAVARGVIVVEAGGNGAEDLDDPLYDQRPPGFPASWSNPLNRQNPSSGAILVGAGAPPAQTHGRDWGPDRSRLDFSNHGQRVDAQGWGREVTTCAYGDLQGGADEDLWYTDAFAGTSSASPIVTGVVACLQGILRARGQAPLDPRRARDLLRSTGSPQTDAPGRPSTERIGNRPDLRALLKALAGAKPTPKPKLKKSAKATATATAKAKKPARHKIRPK